MHVVFVLSAYYSIKVQGIRFQFNMNVVILSFLSCTERNVHFFFEQSCTTRKIIRYNRNPRLITKSGPQDWN